MSFYEPFIPLLNTFGLVYGFLEDLGILWSAVFDIAGRIRKNRF